MAIQWPMIVIRDDLPPNPTPDLMPDEVYQTFAGLTLPVVTPLGNYGFWCPFVSETEQAGATGVMCSAEMLMQALEEEHPQTVRWFEENMPMVASGECRVGDQERPYMIVIPAELEARQPERVGIHDRAIHTPDRLPV